MIVMVGHQRNCKAVRGFYLERTMASIKNTLAQMDFRHHFCRRSGRALPLRWMTQLS
jgi:hypothetical protein